MAHAKHVRIESPGFGGGRGIQTVKITAHMRDDGCASWLCFDVTREEARRLALELLLAAYDDSRWN